MNKDLNNNDEIFDDDLDFIPEDEFDDDDFDNAPCEYVGMMMGMFTMPKPLGYLWPEEKIEEFLIARGYKIIKRKNKGNKIKELDTLKFAVKPEDTCIPEDDISNLRETFDKEVQDILFKWLLKIGKE